MKAYIRHEGVASFQDFLDGSVNFEFRCRMTLLPESPAEKVEVDATQTELKTEFTAVFRRWLSERGITPVQCEHSRVCYFLGSA